MTARELKCRSSSCRACQEQREFALHRSLDLQDVEESLKEAIKSVEKEMKNVTERIDNVAADENNLDAQIEKRREDVERSRKRLEALKSVRSAGTPAHSPLQRPCIMLPSQACLHG